MKRRRGKFPKTFIGLQNVQAKEVNSLKTVGNSIKGFGESHAEESCSSLVALSRRLFTHMTMLVLSAPRQLFY